MSVAIVTGASRGLGQALAEGLAREGWSLVIDGRDATALEAAAARLEPLLAAGSAYRALAGDITDPAHRRDLAAAAAELGGLDLLVNNAGTLGASPLPSLGDYPLDDLRVALEVNVVAPLGVTQAALPLLLDSPRPRAAQHHVGCRRGGVRRVGRLRRRQGGPRPHRRRVRGRVPVRVGVGGRPRRPAHGHAPGRVPRRGHLRPARSGDGGPGLPRADRSDRPSGRYRAGELVGAEVSA